MRITLHKRKSGVSDQNKVWNKKDFGLKSVRVGFRAATRESKFVTGHKVCSHLPVITVGLGTFPNVKGGCRGFNEPYLSTALDKSCKYVIIKLHYWEDYHEFLNYASILKWLY